MKTPDPRAVVGLCGLLLATPALAGSQAWQLTLPAPPPSRVTCSLTSNLGHQVTAVFDPTEDPSLQRTVRLDDAPDGLWRVSCGSARLERPEKQTTTGVTFERSVDKSWAFAGLTEDLDSPLNAGLQDVEIAIVDRMQRRQSDPPVPAWSLVSSADPLFADHPKVVLRRRFQTDTTRVPLESASASFQTAPGNTFDGRSALLAGEVPLLVEDTLDLLAEIALDRAKSRAGAVVARRLTELVCEDVDEAVDKVGKSGDEAVDLTPVFDRTCDRMKGQTLQGMLDDAEGISQAMQQDLVALALRMVETRLANEDANIQRLFHAISPLIERLALERRLPTHDEIAVVVATASQQSWSGEGCAVGLAFAAAASCREAGSGCDGRMLADFVSHPAEHFDLGECDDKLENVVATYPDLPRITARLMDIARPPADTTPGDQAKTAVEAMVGLARTMARAGGDDPKAFVELLDRFEALALAIIDRNEAESIAAGLSLARLAIADLVGEDEDEVSDAALRPLERLAPVVAVLRANARDLAKAEDASDEQAKALREARKERLTALIDASTVRAHRGGEVLVSLGTPVGLYVQSTWQDDGPTGGQPTLGLPMGFAVQQLPRGRGDRVPRNHPQPGKTDIPVGVGVHAQLSLVDLGEFLDKKPGADVPEGERMTWNDFAIIGGQAGLLVGSPSDSFLLGVDARYRPGSGEATVGFVLAYYVPLFDLN